jgi:hypothetical protein
MLPATLAFAYPTIQAMSRHICELLDLVHVEGLPIPAAAARLGATAADERGAPRSAEEAISALDNILARLEGTLHADH